MEVKKTLKVFFSSSSLLPSWDCKEGSVVGEGVVRIFGDNKEKWENAHENEEDVKAPILTRNEVVDGGWRVVG